MESSMPDITMCEGGDCPYRLRCYRFTAKPSGLMQSWFMEPPYKSDEKSCDYYWEAYEESVVPNASTERQGKE